MPQLRPKIISISIEKFLRIREYYSIYNLIFRLKINIWKWIEINMEEYFHAVSYLFEKIDKIQSRFLRELQVNV